MRKSPRTIPVADRLWRRVQKMDSGCWEWQGSKVPLGYGRIKVTTQKAAYTHRVAWELTKGPIPDGLLVCHRCDNPPCCNPDHLFLGTGADNAQDMHNKGRAKVLRGANNGNSKLTAEQVSEIRRRYQPPTAGSIGGNCRALANEYGVTKGTILHIMWGLTWRDAS